MSGCSYSACLPPTIELAAIETTRYFLCTTSPTDARYTSSPLQQKRLAYPGRRGRSPKKLQVDRRASRRAGRRRRRGHISGDDRPCRSFRRLRDQHRWRSLLAGSRKNVPARARIHQTFGHQHRLFMERRVQLPARRPQPGRGPGRHIPRRGRHPAPTARCLRSLHDDRRWRSRSRSAVKRVVNPIPHNQQQDRKTLRSRSTSCVLPVLSRSSSCTPRACARGSSRRRGRTRRQPWLHSAAEAMPRMYVVILTRRLTHTRLLPGQGHAADQEEDLIALQLIDKLPPAAGNPRSAARPASPGSVYRPHRR